MKTLLTIALFVLNLACLAQRQPTYHEFSRFQGESSKGIKYIVGIDGPKAGIEISIQTSEGRDIVSTSADKDKVYSKDKGLEYHYHTPDGLLVLYFDGNRCKTAWWLTEFSTETMSYKNQMTFSR